MNKNKKIILIVSGIVIGILLFELISIDRHNANNPNYSTVTGTTQQSLSELSDITTISTGWWSGECDGRCNAKMILTPQSMVFHSNGGSLLSTCPTINHELSYSKDQWNSLIKLIDLGKFNELPAQIGSPGATDRAIWHIEISDGNNSKRVTFESYEELTENKEFFQALSMSLGDLESKYFTRCR